MNENRRGYLSDYLLERENLIRLLIVAVVLAFGINLLANSISGIIAPRGSLYSGLLVCLGALLILLIPIIFRNEKHKVFKAFLVYDKKKNLIINVPRYEFAEDIVHYLDSGFQENAALKITWDKYPLLKSLEFNGTVPSEQLLLEATEYFILEKLCVHLTDYFATEQFYNVQLITLSREKIPTTLLNNRFLELFSRPLKNRPAFIKESLNDDDNVGEIVSWHAKNGEYFSKFELTLPPKSRITRLDSTTFEIQTPKLNLCFNVKSTDISLLPREFGMYYLGVRDWLKNFQIHGIEIDVDIHFKFGVLFFSKGYDYYKWLDSFLDELDVISGDTFYKSIGWDSALTVIEHLKESKKSIT